MVEAGTLENPTNLLRCIADNQSETTWLFSFDDEQPQFYPAAFALASRKEGMDLRISTCCACGIFDMRAGRESFRCRTCRV